MDLVFFPNLLKLNFFASQVPRNENECLRSNGLLNQSLHDSWVIYPSREIFFILILNLKNPKAMRGIRGILMKTSPSLSGRNWKS